MLTAPVGITVKGMETKKKQTSVMQGFTVLLVKRFEIPMVWSVLLGISVLLVLKNQSDVTVELTRIQSIKCLVRYVVILYRESLCLNLVHEHDCHHHYHCQDIFGLSKFRQNVQQRKII